MDASSTSVLQQRTGENPGDSPPGNNDDDETQKSFMSENDTNKRPPSPKAVVLQSISDEAGSDKLSAELRGDVTEKQLRSVRDEGHGGGFTGELSETGLNDVPLGDVCEGSKDSATEPPPGGVSPEEEEESKLDLRSNEPDASTNEKQSNTEISDAEIQKRAQEEGVVKMAFPGTVTQDGCCRFVSEILKCVLYQRQQLPMTYDQLVYSQKKQQASMQDKDTVNRRPLQSDMDWRKCQQTLQELEEVLQQLEVLFSLSRVPRVLLMMGGSVILPKELWEINMEALALSSADKSLRVSSCLRQLFRTLFVADLLSDTEPVRLMATTVLVLAHRDCGVDWFRPKLRFKVPARVKSKVVILSSDPGSCENLQMNDQDWDDYIWFQAPMTIKGFSNCKA